MPQNRYGSPEQKKIYLPNMMTGKWAGTMNLTEPQCGTDLGLIRTKATPNDNGSYAVTFTVTEVRPMRTVSV